MSARALARHAALGGLLTAISLLAPPVLALELQPFSARYDVYIDGKLQGQSTMTLAEVSPGQWRHDVTAEGTRGLARLAGFEASQTTWLQVTDDRPRIASADSVSENLLRTRRERVVFDWSQRQASWEGDLKANQLGPVALTDAAVNAPLLNLLLALDSRDARQGDVLRYQLLDRGAVSDIDYVVGEIDSIVVPFGKLEARQLRGDRPQKKRVISAWYSAGLPLTPARLMQVEEGKPSYELRLSSLSGAASTTK